MNLTTPLHTGWSVRPADQAAWRHVTQADSIPATVPGGIHADLLDAGLIPDFEHDRNELLVKWVAETPWVYSLTIDWSPTDAQHIDLVCEGLDTFATVRLNGEVIGRSESMHVRHRYPIDAHIRPGANELEIEFEPPMEAMRRLVGEHGEQPHQGHGSNEPMAHNALRKMACAFGWDWGPVVPTSGIWRPISLRTWSGARFGTPRVMSVSASNERATLRVVPDVVPDPGQEAEIEIAVNGPSGLQVATAVVPSGDSHVDLEIEGPRLWWPAGHGEQPLYQVRMTLLVDGTATEARTLRTGIRSAELVTSVDESTPPWVPADCGTTRTFHFVINGRRIFCKGANWIPDSLTPGRISRETYRTRVEQARRANMNMLRVWGGGLYESEAFYSACDELGIMVWQDFLCACSAYHEHEPYRSWFEAEARGNVPRLASHPSLVLWCGNNECHEAVQHWGEFEALREDPAIPWGRGLYEGLFADIVRELDPSRPYWPGSPFTIADDGIDLADSKSEYSGDLHIWDVWNGHGDAKWYLTHAPRFASEFGFHGPPTAATIAESIPADQRRYDSPAMVHHNKHAGGQPLAHTRMADYFEPPVNFDDWLYLAQVLQARSLELGCAWFRALSPWCSGALYWQFNDIWPVSSWAAIDGAGRPKPLWYATRKFFRPRLVTIRPSRPMTSPEERVPLSVYLHNDSPEAWAGTLMVEERDINGHDPDEALRQPVSIAPGATVRVDLPEGCTGERGLLVASVGSDRAFWFPKPDRELSYPLPQANFELERNGEQHELRISARSLIRDLCIFPDRLHPDATVSDQLITLLPGEDATLWVRSPVPLDLTSLTRPPIYQTANRFGAPFLVSR